MLTVSIFGQKKTLKTNTNVDRNLIKSKTKQNNTKGDYILISYLPPSRANKYYSKMALYRTTHNLYLFWTCINILDIIFVLKYNRVPVWLYMFSENRLAVNPTSET